MNASETPKVPAELQALFEAEKARPEPATGDRDAVHTALAATCGFTAVAAGASLVGSGTASVGSGATAGVSTGATVATGATAATSAGISSTLPALLVKPVTLLIFAAGAATGTGTTLLVEHVAVPDEPAMERKAPAVKRTITPPKVAEVTPPAPAAPPAAVLEPVAPPAEVAKAPAEPPAPARRTTKRARVTRTPRSPTANTSVVERNLLERARTALSRGQAAAALRALRQHRKQYPGGTLAEERAALMVVALADLGKGARARAAARKFKKRYPHSLLLFLVDNALKRAPAAR